MAPLLLWERGRLVFLPSALALYGFCRTFAARNGGFTSPIWLAGDVTEWLGRGLQNLLQRFESARRLTKRNRPVGKLPAGRFCVWGNWMASSVGLQ